MAAETVALRNKTRKVKDHIIDRYLKLASRIDTDESLSENEAAKYWELTTIFAKSVLPRTQEITGEEGGSLVITFAKEVAVKNDINESDTSTGDNSEGSPSV